MLAVWSYQGQHQAEGILHSTSIAFPLTWGLSQSDRLLSSVCNNLAWIPLLKQDLTSAMWIICKSQDINQYLQAHPNRNRENSFMVRWYVATCAEFQLHTETEKTVLWYGDMWQYLLSASSTQKQRKQFYGTVICGNICWVPAPHRNRENSFMVRWYVAISAEFQLHTCKSAASALTNLGHSGADLHYLGTPPVDSSKEEY